MSSKLPREIWINIFLQLHQDDRVECMLVCHDWNRTIERFVHYQTVFIYSTTAQNKLIEKIHQRPEIANKIENLVFSSNCYFGDQEKVNYLRLLSSLTNLKELHSSVGDISDDSNSNYPWCKKIRHLTYLSCNRITCLTLLSNTYPNLTTLKILYLSSDIFPIFNSMPALISLTIDICRIISFDQLEMMHQNLLHLKSLRIYLIASVSFEFDKRNTIPAATSITEYHFEFCDEPRDFNSIIRFLEYIPIKYPNITKLVYKTKGLALPIERQQTMIDIGLTPLLQKLGARLEYLHLYRVDDCLFNLLHSSSYTLSYLNLDNLTFDALEKIASSQQALYIQKFTLINSKCGSFHWLKDIQALKRIKLVKCSYDESGSQIQLDDIIANAPKTLESLSLKSLAFAFDPNYTGTSNIKTLSLSFTTIRDGMDCFVSRCFPKLTTLKLNYCDIQGNKLRLTKTDLLALHYSTRFSKYNISVVTLRNNERRFYTLQNHIENKRLSPATYISPQNYIPLKSYPVNKVNSANSTLVLTCNSLGRLILELYEK